MAKTKNRPARITGIVRLGKELFRRGQEAELGAKISPAQAKELGAKGAITGDWSELVKGGEAESEEPAAEEKKTPRRGRG